MSRVTALDRLLDRWEGSPRLRKYWGLLWPMLIALIAGGMFFGASLTDGTLAWGIAVAVAVLVLLMRAGVRAIVEPWPRLRNLRREGTNANVAMLAWQILDRDGLLTERGQHEITTTARARLERLGVAWVGGVPPEEAAALLGPELVELLTTPQPSSFDIRRVGRCLHHLDSLITANAKTTDAQEPEND